MDLASTLVYALGIFYQLIAFAILIRCIISWLPLDRNNFFVNIIYSLTEPILGPIRRLINRSPLGGGMMIDFSPIIAYFALELVYRALLILIVNIF